MSNLRTIHFVISIGFIASSYSPLAAQVRIVSKDNAPRVIVAMPMAVEMGKTTKIVLRGLRIDAVTEIRLHEPRTTGKIIGKAKKFPVPNDANVNQIGDSEIEIEVTLPKEVPGGGVPFSLVSPDGDSKPHQLIVKDDTPIVVEKEPNDGLRQAQPIAIPCVVEGSIREAFDVDVFRFEGKQGQRLVFDLQANRFGSPLDGMLTLYDEAGRTIASVDDSPGSIDPILTVTLPRDGAYCLALIDVRDQGGSIYLYRLIVRLATR